MPRRLLQELGVDPADTPVVIPAGGEILRNPANDGGWPGDRHRRQGTSAGPLRRGRGRRRPGRPRRRRLRAPPRASTPRRSRPSPPAARPAPRPGSRTTSASPPGISGSELTQRAGVQAIKFGARLTAPGHGAWRCGARRAEHEIELSHGRGRHRARRGDRHRCAVPAPRRAAPRGVRDGRASTTRRPRPRRSSAPATRS